MTAAGLRRRRAELGRRVGILGGTFDPVHNGHLAMARAVKESLALDALLFIPAANPPHKSRERISPFADRARMVELAVASRPGLFVSSLEGERPGPSYSVDTLGELHRQLDPVQLFFLVGFDALADLGSWKEYQRLLDLADLVVLDRPPFRREFLEQAVKRLFPDYRYDPGLKAWAGDQPGRIHPCDVEPVPVSATQVREKARAGEPVGDLVPAPVAAYLRGRRLYR
ncbi:MAG: nicotinate-nucleotide adenylyltransferase [Desulfobacteraceae bacterium]|nr:nicotinate-nucleotide adenylyltransferase [Desulfobacteraceae bacterium]